MNPREPWLMKLLAEALADKPTYTRAFIALCGVPLAANQATLILDTAIKLATPARPLAEWHEDMGPVLWWAFPISEAPYIGTPLDVARQHELKLDGTVIGKFDTHTGWPGYHTHWTPLPPLPLQPQT